MKKRRENSMHLKKRPKVIIILVVCIVTLLLLGFIIFNTLDNHKTVKEVKIENSIDEYGYNLKENKSKEYKAMFKELETILKEKEVDEEAYVKKIAEMFIYDFYSLSDKTAKTDVGGLEFVHSYALENFIQNAEDTYYKYLESNIYDNRKQALPVVGTITVDDVQNTQFAYGEEVDENAYTVKVSWDYTDDGFSDYQNSATLVFVHEGIKLSLVELK